MKMKLDTIVIAWSNSKLTPQFFRHIKQMHITTPACVELHPSQLSRRKATNSAISCVCEQKRQAYLASEAVRRAQNDAHTYSELRSAVLDVYADVREQRIINIRNEAEVAAKRKSVLMFIDANCYHI